MSVLVYLMIEPNQLIPRAPLPDLSLRHFLYFLYFVRGQNWPTILDCHYLRLSELIPLHQNIHTQSPIIKLIYTIDFR